MVWMAQIDQTVVTVIHFNDLTLCHCISLSIVKAQAESQKPRQRVSIAVRKVFAKIRKVFAIR